MLFTAWHYINFCSRNTSIWCCDSFHDPVRCNPHYCIQVSFFFERVTLLLIAMLHLYAPLAVWFHFFTNTLVIYAFHPSVGVVTNYQGLCCSFLSCSIGNVQKVVSAKKGNMLSALAMVSLYINTLLDAVYI